MSPLLREDGDCGAISLYSKSRTSYTTETFGCWSQFASRFQCPEHALTFERTKESALVDQLTEK